jgi:hypothetical protein
VADHSQGLSHGQRPPNHSYCDSDIEVELAFRGLDLSDVDVEIADRIGFELFLPDFEGQSTAPVGSTDERQNGPDTGIARVEAAPCHRAQKQ